MIFNFQLGKIASIKIQNLNKKLKKYYFYNNFHVAIIGLISSVGIYLILLIILKYFKFFDLNLSIISGLFFTILYITLSI